MSLHARPEYNLPEIVKGLELHGLEPRSPSQLADAFRQGFVYARSQFLTMADRAMESTHCCVKCQFYYTPVGISEDCPHCGCDGT